jgi:hypothetical protein
VVDNENEMSIHKFVYLMSNMAEIIFPGEQNSILAIVNSYLSERHSVTENQSTTFPFSYPKILAVKPRSMVWDDNTKKLLFSNVVQQYIDYETDLKASFTCYFQENLKMGKIF